MPLGLWNDPNISVIALLHKQREYLFWGGELKDCNNVLIIGEKNNPRAMFSTYKFIYLNIINNWNIYTVV